jgi:hypothetical protein
MLRQAPNIILVGEIRDREVGEVADPGRPDRPPGLQHAAHQRCPQRDHRLIDMGIKPFLVASSIQAIMAQRLIRRDLRRVQGPSTLPRPLQAAAARHHRRRPRGPPRLQGGRLQRCSGTGYRGRQGIFEMLEMNNEMRELAFKRGRRPWHCAAPPGSGMRTLLEDGKLKILRGVTTPDGAVRITQAEGILIDGRISARARSRRPTGGAVADERSTAVATVTLIVCWKPASASGASDIHLHVGRPPVLRLDGGLRSLETKSLEPDDTVALMKSVTPERNQQELQEEGGTDYGFAFGDKGRFRVSVFRQKGNISMVLRLIPSKILTFEEIGLPKIVRACAGARVVCSWSRARPVRARRPRSRRCSTTSTATFDRHIITVEDPIEYYHKHHQVLLHPARGRRRRARASPRPCAARCVWTPT